MLLLGVFLSWNKHLHYSQLDVDCWFVSGLLSVKALMNVSFNISGTIPTFFLEVSSFLIRHFSIYKDRLLVSMLLS